MVKGIILPSRGNVPLGSIAAVIADAQRLLGASNEIDVRSVLVKADGRLSNVATVMRVGFTRVGSASDSEVHEAGDLLLVAARFSASGVRNERDLVDRLGAWTFLLKCPDHPEFQANPYCTREPSNSHWASDPIWVITLYDNTPGARPNAPAGPFYDPATHFIAESVRAAVHQWLSTPRDVDSVTNDYVVIIRDPRAKIWERKIAYSDDAANADLILSISTDISEVGPIDVGVIETPYEGAQRRKTYRHFTNPLRANLRLPLRDLEVWAFDSTTGEWLDQFRDSAHSQLGDSLLAPQRAKQEPGYKSLLTALESGESDTVEFKYFLPFERKHSKATELLKTVVAFANSRGGSLFIGISDDAEVVGVPDKALSELGQNVNLSPDKLRAAYADRLRKLISEGIDPIVTVALEWVQHAGLHVLRISVPLSPAAPHQIVEGGEFYERRGATSKRGLPERFIRRPKQ